MPRRPSPAIPRAARRKSSESWRLPAANRVAGRLIERPRQQTALRNLDVVQSAVGHRQECRASVQGIDPRYPGMITMEQFPEIDAIGPVERVHGAGQGAFIVDAAVPAAYPVQPVGGIESEQGGERPPLQDMRVDLPFVATQRKIGALTVGES